MPHKITLGTIVRKTKTAYKSLMKPDISVIIPFYNVEEYIEECIQSLLVQKGIVLELIFVDDGSTDSSGAIVKKYINGGKNVRLIKTPHKGPGYARNCGVKHAKGEYIAFMDADDLLVKGIYCRMLNSARNNNADVCICNVARFNSKAVWSSDLHEKVYKNYNTITSIRDNPYLIYDTCSVNKLIKRDFYRKSGISFPEDVVYEDISFNIDLHLKCDKIVVLCETGYLWRVREDKDNLSISQLSYSDKNVSDRFTASKWIVEHVANWDVPEALRQEAQYRLLITDLKIILDSVKHVSEEQAKVVFSEVTEFIDTHISSEIMRRLPIADAQRYRFVREGNVEGYRDFIDYRWKHYNNAPVEEKEGLLLAHLPDDFFSVEKRTLNDEFARLQRRTWVDAVRITDEGIEVDAHLYIRRYNMAKPGDQDLKVYLVNEENGQKILMKYQIKSTKFLTKNYGDILDEYQGTISHYNYDYTGFSFTVDDSVAKINSRYKKTKYSVVVEYKDRLFSGTQIIKGASNRHIKECKSLKIHGNGCEIYTEFGIQGELQIAVNKDR